MAKKKTQEPLEITPEGSVVPVYRAQVTPEQEAEQKRWAEEAAAREAKEAAAIEHRTNAIAKLAELGLTVDEIEAAFGLV